MTNSEAIKQLVYVRRNLDEYLDEDRIDAVNDAINALEENDRFKEDVEILSKTNESLVRKDVKIVFKIRDLEQEIIALQNTLNETIDESCDLYREIEQLKSENEQLKISDASKEQSSTDYYNLYRQALNEIEQLKSELEQSEITRNKQIDVLLQEIEQLESIINTYEVKKDFKEFCDRRDREESKLKVREAK